MTDREELQQQLLEFIYGLLSDDEAARMNERITSDGDVARAYAEARQEADLMAAAARLEQPPVELKRPEEAAVARAEPVAPATAPLVTPAPAGSNWTRGANWFIGLATAILVLITGYMYFKPDSPVNSLAVGSAQQEIADRHLRLVVTGPGRLQADATNYFTVATSTADGTPVDAPVAYAVYSPTGEPLVNQSDATGEDGRLQITLPPSLALKTNSRLEVLAYGANNRRHHMKKHLQVEEPRHVTRLSLDKPLYRPGETVYYRSLTLSRFGLAAKRDLPIQFEILNPAGGIVDGSQLPGVTDHGVGNGQFAIPAHLPGGTYTLIAKSLDDTFPEEKREFFIRRYRTPRLKKQLEFARDSYTPGDEVVADFSAERAEGGPAADAQLRIVVTVDGEPVSVATPAPKTSSAGTYQVKFTLPEKIEKGDGTLAVVVDDGGTRETIAKTIPINLGKVEVSFYPEGGDLVAGLSNRVYFHAFDPLGKPVHIEGRVVDSGGNDVAAVETTHEGRGAFRFEPKADETYKLIIDSPQGVVSEPPLPVADSNKWLVMDTGAGVFDAGKPIELDILSTRKDVPLVVSAVCRGVQAGQRELVTKSVSADGENRTKVAVPLTPEAAGVVRVTVYDYTTAPPKPVAERLVYRHSSQKLNVAVADHSEAYSPGEGVNLSLIVTDESGKPVPAAMGVTVVDDALLSLADDKSPKLNTHFLLTTEIEKPEDLEDANFFLSDDADAAEALDMLLGTQGWRRFVEVTLEELRLANGLGNRLGNELPSPGLADSGLADSSASQSREALTRLVAMEGKAVAPVTHDNLAGVKREVAAELAVFNEQRVAKIQHAGRIVLLGGLAVLVTLTLMALLRLAGDARVWVPALGIAAACGAIGVLWMEAAIDSEGDVAVAAFPSFAVKEVRVAQSAPDSVEGEKKGAEKTGDYDDEDAGAEAQQKGEQEGKGLPGEPMPGGDKPGAEDEERLRLGEAGERDDGKKAKLPKVDRPGWAKDMELKEELADLRDFDPDDIVDGRFREGAGRAGGKYWAGDITELGKLRRKLDRIEKLADDDERLALGKVWEENVKRFRFTVRQYAHKHRQGPPGVRTDFAETVYWHPLLIADESGRASIEFELSDSVTTFRVLADAHGNGRIGSGDGDVISRIPFSLEPKLPLQVNAGDRIDLPLAVNNDTNGALPVTVLFAYSDLLKLDGDAERTFDLTAKQRGREYFALNVVGQTGQAELEFRGQAGNLRDGIKKSIEVVPPGFPAADSYAGKLDADQTLVIPMPDGWVEGSLSVSLQAFPSSLADLQKGLDSILREPCGCFEQTSTSNYPNVLALKYMQEHDVADPEFTRRAKELLKKGYGRLVSFECKKKGYEWFGGDPGHEALTAYGLMEFSDMQGVWDVDEEMVRRTAKWLMDRRDGKGGFMRNKRALDSFGRAPPEITNAYIVWALTEARQEEIDPEVEQVIKLAEASDDPYLIALAAASAINTNRKDPGLALLDKLVKYQKEDGHLAPLTGTITRSGGLSAKMETTSLAAIAWLKTSATAAHANSAVEWISKNRQGSGGFGSTQATILALKALIEHAKVNKTVTSDGSLIVIRDDAEIGRTDFTAGDKQAITVEGLAAELTSGENELTIRLTGDNQMPYVLDVSYRTHKPVSDEDCPVRLATSLAAETVKAGETVGLSVELSNTSGKDQPMTLAIVGLPAGLEARPDQLEEMKEAGKFAYYEINARELIFYWRGLSKDTNHGDRIKLNLDLVAEIPGKYTAPASRAYLYYTAEQKHWVDPLRVEITKE